LDILLCKLENKLWTQLNLSPFFQPFGISSVLLICFLIIPLLIHINPLDTPTNSPDKYLGSSLKTENVFPSSSFTETFPADHIFNSPLRYLGSSLEI
jgi:hypothetical protein